MHSSDNRHLLARSRGLLDDRVVEARAVVFGLGSVGSYAAEVLARSGIGELVLVDPETVQADNLCRAGFIANDVGRPKVEAVERRLRRINPGLRVTTHASSVEDLGPAKLATLLGRVDVAVVGMDSNSASNVVCRFAYWAGVPSVHIGIWTGGAGGEVVLSAPTGPCYICATAMRHQVDAVAPGTLPTINYGLDRVEAVNALVADIHHVASAGTKLVLGLLSSPNTTPARKLVDRVVSDGAVFLVVGNQLDFWAFPDLHASVPGQYAFQSVWSRVGREPSCAVCGPVAGRVDPSTTWVPHLSGADLWAARG